MCIRDSYCAKPGMVIGKGGEERVALQNKLTKEYGKTVIVNVIEVKSASTLSLIHIYQAGSCGAGGHPFQRLQGGHRCQGGGGHH